MIVVVVIVVAYLFCANASVDRTKTTYFLDFIFIHSPTLCLRHPKKLLALLLIHSSVLFDILYIYIYITIYT